MPPENDENLEQPSNPTDVEQPPTVDEAAIEARGREAGLSEADEIARAAGFDGVRDMAEKARAKPAANAAQQADRRELSKARRENAELVEERRKLNQAISAKDAEIAKLGRRVKELERQLTEVEQRFELRELARECGVVDADYATELLRRQVSKLPAEEAKAFDQRKFFGEQLKQTHPHLYKAVAVPANTSPVEAEPAPAGKKGEESAGEPVDVRSWPREKYEAHLRKKGLAVPGLS